MVWLSQDAKYKSVLYETVFLRFKCFFFFADRLPEQTLAAFDRLAMPNACYNDMSMNPYYQVNFSYL